VVAHHADRTAAEADCLRGEDEGLHDQPRVDGGVHEHVQVVVGKGLASQLGQAPQAAVVAAEHHEEGRLGDPGHVGDEAGDRRLRRLVLDEDDRRLLQVGFGARGEGGGQEHLEQIVGDRIGCVPTVGPAPQHARELALGRHAASSRSVAAEPVLDQVRHGRGHG
jgi:hypothetical protein